MDLSIIIVNYKSLNKLSLCLKSISKASLKDVAYEIILVDNNSGDNLGPLIASLDFCKISFIDSPRNLGMGGGNNLGISKASGRYILILNPDVLVSPGAIEELLAHLKLNPAIGLVGPKLLNNDHSLQYSCFRFPGFFMPLFSRTFLGRCFSSVRDRFQMKDVEHNAILEVDWLLGSALLFKKETVLPDGTIWEPLFDERYFMYFEDIDLCRQAKERGLKVIYYPRSIFIHDHARQSAKYPWWRAIFCDALARRHISSWLKYFRKWGLS